MKYKLYSSIPDVDDFVMFTETILDLFKAAGSTYYIKYRGQSLMILEVIRHTHKPTVTLTFLSIPLNVKDIIGIELDGTIASPSSLELEDAIVFQSAVPIVDADICTAQPRNNDGRTECFWCPGTRTQKRGGGMYDVCPKCGR